MGLGLLGLLGVGTPILGAILDFFQGQRANEEIRRQNDRSLGRLNKLDERLNIDELYGNLPISYGGTRLAGGGFGGIDIANLFQTGDDPLVKTLQNALGEMPNFGPGRLNLDDFSFDPSRLLGAGTDVSSQLTGLGRRLGRKLGRTSQGIVSDLGTAGNQIGGLLFNAQLDPGELFSQVDFPEFTGEARQAAALSGVSDAASRASQLAAQDISGRALAGGQSIEQALGSVGTAQRQIGGQAGQAATQVASNIEGQQQQHGLAKANLQAGLTSQEAQINSALAQTLAGLQAQLAGTGAEVGAGLATSAATLRSALAQAGAMGLLGAETSAAGLQAGNQAALLQGKIAERAQILQAQGMAADEAFRRAQAEVQASQADITLGLNADAQRVNAITNLLLNPKLNLLAIQAGLAGQGADLISNQQLFFPQFSGALQTAFQNLIGADAASQSPKTGYNFSVPVIGGGFGQSCIDGNSLIATPGGLRPLFHVKPGDEVFDDKMEPRKVLAVDYGTAPQQHRNNHLILATQAGSIILTKDHPVAGKPAGEWQVGDMMKMASGQEVKVVHVMPASYVVSGDLYLEAGMGYIADGFVVGSNLAKIVESLGVEAWNKIDAENKTRHAQEV